MGASHPVRDCVERYATDRTCNYFVASMQRGDLNHQEASHCMELFTREVMLHFADAAVAGSTA
jgi:hypothetical protein